MAHAVSMKNLNYHFLPKKLYTNPSLCSGFKFKLIFPALSHSCKACPKTDGAIPEGACCSQHLSLHQPSLQEGSEPKHKWQF